MTGMFVVDVCSRSGGVPPKSSSFDLYWQHLRSIRQNYISERTRRGKGNTRRRLQMRCVVNDVEPKLCIHTRLQTEIQLGLGMRRDGSNMDPGAARVQARNHSSILHFVMVVYMNILSHHSRE